MNTMKFQLGQDVHDADDVLKMVETLLTGNFTMGSQVQKFEQTFAQYVGSKYAVMVNSGSSANLLAIAILQNYKSNKLMPGDKVLVPAVCWSTSVFPLIQYDLSPVFVDTDPQTLNIDLADLEKKITPKTKAIMLVHVLGNCTNMDKLLEIVKKHNLILIEDTCESLGSTYNEKYLGTFGDVGTYSFYYSHHITTCEGGMVVTDDEELYELAKCLRAHGWSRLLKDKETIHSQHPDIDERFCFVNLGYNLRPMEIQATMGLSQLSKLKTKNDYRKENYAKIKAKIENDPRGKFLSFPVKEDKSDPAWFGITLILDKEINLKDFLSYLTNNGVENRPIISGNFIRQPVIKDLYPLLKPENFPGAEELHHHGLFIGLSCHEMSDELINELVEILLSYNQEEAALKFFKSLV